MLSLLFTEILYRPIFNILVVFLEIFWSNLGLAIILLTVLIRLLMIKQTSMGNDMQKGMGDMQPKLNALQEKYKDDPKKLSEETMKVFKTDGKGPLKGCLMMLIQIPVFIGLFNIIQWISGMSVWTDFTLWGSNLVGFNQFLYSFLSFGQHFADPANINHIFLWMDMLATKNIILAIIAGWFTFLQMQLTTLAKPATPTVPGGAAMPDMSKMMGMMNYFMTFMIGSFVYGTQAGVGLYITTTSVFSVVQYAIQYRALIKAKFYEWRTNGQNVVMDHKKHK